MSRRVAVVAHTHWDREWYAAFSEFRLRLVRLLDDFLPEFEADAAFSHFLLDGQMAPVDDYLAWRPEAESRLRRLATSGRLSVGPWYVLMDEFAVSGETIVRNLQLGVARAAAFGGAMPVGYLPDMFGHVAQMPQILRSAGFEHAVVWRGVPAAVDRTGFWWRGLDGSTVRTEYLPVGYSNGAHLPGDPDNLLRRLGAHQEEIGAFLRSPADPLLLMAGTDHQTPQTVLPAVVAEANQIQEDFELELTSLAAYLARAPTTDLPSWTGELRSGARANLLMGVHSNRVDVKISAARAERALEALAEPLATLWIPAERWPDAALADAWRGVILNSAHDSVCACSADEVGIAVMHRYGEAAATGAGITADALRWASLAIGGPGVAVVNPAHRARAGVVELDVEQGPVSDRVQVLSTLAAATTVRTGTGADLARLLGQLSADGWLSGTRATAARVDRGADAVDLAIETDAASPASPGVAQVMAEAWAQAGANRQGALRVTVRRAATQRVAVRVADVPGYGWSAWSLPDAMGAPVTAAAVAGGDDWLDNGLVHLAVDPTDGTFSINGLAGFDRLVDGGDAGDTYNYSPPAHDTVVDSPEAVSICPGEQGPVRGRLHVSRRYRWSAAVEGERRTGVREVTAVTALELQMGSGLVRVTTSFDNPSRDHRLRAWFPLPSPADHSVAECAFGTVWRPLDAEGGPHEKALATYPSRRFVTAGGLTVTHEGLTEYEIVDNGRALAITLLRATGMLSRPAPAYRPNAAGPADPLEAPQMIGPLTVSYALAVGQQDPFRLAEEAWLPLMVVRAAGTRTRRARGSALQVEGAEVSSLRRVGDAVELRVFNPYDTATTVRVRGHAGSLVDLQGRAVERWAECFGLRPWGIATARLDADVGDSDVGDGDVSDGDVS